MLSLKSFEQIGLNFNFERNNDEYTSKYRRIASMSYCCPLIFTRCVPGTGVLSYQVPGTAVCTKLMFWH